jgi:hypothetical protein
MLGATGVAARNVITHERINVTRETCVPDGPAIVCFTGHWVIPKVVHPDGDYVMVLNLHTVATTTLNGVFSSFDVLQEHSHTAFQAGELREAHERSAFTSTFVIAGTTYACVGTTDYHFAGGEVKVDELNITCDPQFPPPV